MWERLQIDVLVDGYNEDGELVGRTQWCRCFASSLQWPCLFTVHLIVRLQ